MTLALEPGRSPTGDDGDDASPSPTFSSRLDDGVPGIDVDAASIPPVASASPLVISKYDGGASAVFCWNARAE